MRKLGKLLSITTRERRPGSEHAFSRGSAGEPLLDCLRPNAAKPFVGRSRQTRAPRGATITPPFGAAGERSAQEENLARALQQQAKAALRFTKLVGEAEKAATSAERSRIAHDLHDSITHCLTGIYTQLEAATQLRQENPDVADSCVRKASELAHAGLQEVRRLVGALRPDASEYSDLVENLRRLAFESSCEANTKVRFIAESALRVIPADVGYQLSQIAREAVGNALRYAQAKSVTLRLAFSEPGVALSIEDDGIGFRPGRPTALTGYGLNAMRQRANRIGAKFNLRTSPGAGTVIQISACCPAWSRTG
jgi:signal transduction histidine kinase